MMMMTWFAAQETFIIVSVDNNWAT